MADDTPNRPAALRPSQRAQYLTINHQHCSPAMPNEIVVRLMLWLVATVQISIVVATATVWWRWRYFSPTVMLQSWYSYFSADGAAGARFLYPTIFTTTHNFSIGFDLDKTMLFGALYHQILTLPKVRGAVLVLSSAAVVGICSAVSYDFYLTVPSTGSCSARCWPALR